MISQTTRLRFRELIADDFIQKCNVDLATRFTSEQTEWVSFFASKLKGWLKSNTA